LTVALDVADLAAGYGATVVIDGVSLEVPGGGTLAVLGRNGVGKTTLLTTLMGYTTRHRGAIKLGETAVEELPTHRRVLAGLGYVPQEREIFPSLTAEENLAVAARPGGWTADQVFELFPRLAERRRNAGNRLSGGEQQMLAVGRALVGGPQVLLLDEPMEGLAPIVIDALFDALCRIRDEGRLTIVLVEQKVDLALDFARAAVILDRGRIVYRGTADELKRDEAAQARHLGAGADHVSAMGR
jgi:branched-chain amino acid transport system ATP-binding protein